MMMNRSGTVYFKDIMAGTINETDDGYEFEHLPQYLASTDAEPISLTIPKNTAGCLAFLPRINTRGHMKNAGK